MEEELSRFGKKKGPGGLTPEPKGQKLKIKRTNDFNVSKNSIEKKIKTVMNFNRYDSITIIFNSLIKTNGSKTSNTIEFSSIFKRSSDE
ncbi:hypothetical protein [Ekhidna sp.]|uniref:hypothetical protein n=1 Tax=Ekhidna sp. TaxID=2608089 RepID=UPI0032977434